MYGSVIVSVSGCFARPSVGHETAKYRWDRVGQSGCV